MICLLVMGRSFMKWLEKLRWHSSLYTNAMVCLRASTMSLRADKMSGIIYLHVFPRYHNDELYQTSAHHEFLEADERASYAQRLREYLLSTK
jgi:hypothetical protein